MKIQMNNQAQNQMFFKNPILSGFYPDPSICRVGDDYYLVTSSFVYFPGVPIFHSRDLVHWEQIGHVLSRPSQLDLSGAGYSEGIYAPTLRHHNGIFYLITTNISKGGNFIVTASDPAGPWSDPYWLPDAPGIDPSLFFDVDGRAYYTGTRPAPEGERYPGNWEIWLQELNLNTMSLTGEKFPLWRGAMRDVIWPEGPHVYKKDGWYYLLISEGGTDYYHSVTVARSREITGPYTGNPANPILTHRHLGRSYPITNTGHADLVETPQGEWWMVALASRPYGGYYRNLGRETFLVPVIWEDGWPVVSPGTGRIEMSYPVPRLPSFPVQPQPDRDHFDSTSLGLDWNFIRTPREQFWSLSERPGYLRVRLKPERIIEQANPAFIGRRQRHICFSAAAAMEFTPENVHEAAGIVLVQNNHFYYRFEYGLRDQAGIILLVRCVDGVEEEIAARAFTSKRIFMRITGREQNYSFYYGPEEEAKETLLENADGRILSTDVAGGFVGTYIGVFAGSNGHPSRNYADFDWFEYREEERQGGNAKDENYT